MSDATIETDEPQFCHGTDRSVWDAIRPRRQAPAPAPPAVASFFYYYTSDPSLLDSVQFQDWSWDSAGIASSSWQLGDGAPPVDGLLSRPPLLRRRQLLRPAGHHDERRALRVIDSDGGGEGTRHRDHGSHGAGEGARRAHEADFRSRQRRSRSRDGAGVDAAQHSRRRLRAGRSGDPGRARTRGTAPPSFDISYTFSPEDAALGKVTFEAVASILSARDANPSDNTVIAPATKITG
jgi:hypothetical protein